MGARKTAVVVWLTVVVLLVTILSFLVSFQATQQVMQRKASLLTPANFSFKMFSQEKTWKHAQSSCYAIESRLVEVYNEVQQSKLRQFIRSSGTPKNESCGYWMGGFKKISNWTWASTGDYIYKYYARGWHMKKPDNSLKNGQAKNCMEMQLIKNFGDGSLSWNNIDCKEKRRYICHGPYLN